jgi:hypothetical protein
VIEDSTNSQTAAQLKEGGPDLARDEEAQKEEEEEKKEVRCQSRRLVEPEVKRKNAPVESRQ